MRRSIFALAVVAVALPGLALAGEPVPMNDSELDSVAAGLSLGALDKITVQQVLAHPNYGPAIALLRREDAVGVAARAEAVRRLALVPDPIYNQNEQKLRAVLPSDLHFLLRSSN